MFKNITFSADDNLISAGRKKTSSEKTTLNEKFRQWLSVYASSEQFSKNYLKLMDKLSYVEPGKKFTREEMNER